MAPAKGSYPFPSPTRSGNARTRRGSGAQRASVTMAAPLPTFTYFTYLHPRAPTVFSLGGSERPPEFLPILLLLSGDIETNPGPYPCPTCTRPYKRTLGAIPCPGCGSWTHMVKRCSGFNQNHPIPHGWVCISCHPTHNISTQNTNSIQHPPPPHSSTSPSHTLGVPPSGPPPPPIPTPPNSRPATPLLTLPNTPLTSPTPSSSSASSSSHLPHPVKNYRRKHR